MQIFDSQNRLVTASDQTRGRINIITMAVIMSAAFAIDGYHKPEITTKPPGYYLQFYLYLMIAVR